MLATYQAVLKGDRLEWTEAIPSLLQEGEGVPVIVTILPATPEVAAKRGREMAAALEDMAAQGGIESIPDPVAWQREIRQDPPLPGRAD